MGIFQYGAYLGWQLEHFGLDATKEVRPQTSMELLDLLFVEFFVLFRQVLEVIPFGGVQKVHQIEQFPNVVVQRSL